MPVILLVLGLVIAVVGAAAIAYGIPINEFSFGNTLIVAGTVALVGGLILIGVASAARQLRRIADNLDMQPMSWSLEAPNARRTASVAPPLVKPEPAKEPEVRPQERVVPPPVAEAVPDKPAAPEQPAEPEPAAPEPRVDLAPLAQLPEPEPAPRVPPPVARPAPAAPNPAAPNPAAPMPAAPMPAAPMPAAPMPIEAKPERPVRPVRPAGEAMRPAPPRAAAPAATIFKSGVIDGMAYTLYTDGSIEAELAQGRVRFATVEELQNYLLRGKNQ